ncbi:unnamed protein product [Rangifer tarandus platyrhynchus]|uniref:Uncharacterized protein n=2 Tax=Rangifer tarandus platyrhynchus TaxID=3082113 RepID=A0ABN8ZHR7_RANTA|nr:unnamed protein product [Rangifer tarandus platyrhynchus]CAI9705942.1 unnamed protein product [Rangifer tarandus platyrhynchus]
MEGLFIEPWRPSSWASPAPLMERKQLRAFLAAKSDPWLVFWELVGRGPEPCGPGSQRDKFLSFCPRTEGGASLPQEPTCVHSACAEDSEVAGSSPRPVASSLGEPVRIPGLVALILSMIQERLGVGREVLPAETPRARELKFNVAMRGWVHVPSSRLRVPQYRAEPPSWQPRALCPLQEASHSLAAAFSETSKGPAGAAAPAPMNRPPRPEPVLESEDAERLKLERRRTRRVAQPSAPMPLPVPLRSERPRPV